MKSLTKDEVWETVRGMTWVWDYCSTGDHEKNALAVQGWLNDRGLKANRKVCKSVAVAIRKYNESDVFSGGIGTGIGQSWF